MFQTSVGFVFAALISVSSYDLCSVIWVFQNAGELELCRVLGTHSFIHKKPYPGGS